MIRNSVDYVGLVPLLGFEISMVEKEENAEWKVVVKNELKDVENGHRHAHRFVVERVWPEAEVL